MLRRPVAAPVAPAPTPGDGWIATLHAATPYAAAPGSAATGTVSATNPFGVAQVLAVIGRPGADGWAHVELPVRPNGSTGWIRTAGVTLTWTRYRIDVSTEARTLTVSLGDRPIVQAPVAIGTSATPTPHGQTYVWELVAPDNPNGDYGPYIFGLAMFSDAIARVNGADAQIAIHGTDQPSSIGRAASHGCIRMTNADVSKLVGVLPLGTPVTIS